MPTTQLPGFRDLVHDSQATFRALLAAMAHPGIPAPIPVEVMPPAGLCPASAAACLTLFDLDTTTWLAPGFGPEVRSWLTFHTGCRFTDDPAAAQFALVGDANALPSLSVFHPGTIEEPEQSTTLLVQVQGWRENSLVRLRGPGIEQEQTMPEPIVADQFWQEWAVNHQGYPLGVDVLFFHPDGVIGLPRTTTVYPV
jgi:alpha-D-ribose 1-methylphosphonate 5-triphosphate synthase subunit PhnH